MTFISLFFIFLIVSSIQPAIQRRLVASRRLAAIRNLEQQRGSRVILLIHRQESISLLDIPISRFINIEDSEQILRAIRLTPSTVPIDYALPEPPSAADGAGGVRGCEFWICDFG